MVRLTRTVRFSLNPHVADDTDRAAARGANGFSSIPAMDGLGRHYEIEVAVLGSPDPVTGYLINIKKIDSEVRAGIVPILAGACAQKPRTHPIDLLGDLWSALAQRLPVGLDRLRWRLSPYLSVSMEKHAMEQLVFIRQQYDLSAAHRLHSSRLSEAENRAAFGKCNNPSGHGHNYRIETAVAVPTAPAGPPPPSPALLERVVQDAIIDRYDHKHLNIDTPEFDESRGGVNPSVENIARVFYDRLSTALQAAHAGSTSGAPWTPVALWSVTVWETDRTCATYPAHP